MRSQSPKHWWQGWQLGNCPEKPLAHWSQRTPDTPCWQTQWPVIRLHWEVSMPRQSQSQAERRKEKSNEYDYNLQFETSLHFQIICFTLKKNVSKTFIFDAIKKLWEAYPLSGWKTKLHLKFGVFARIEYVPLNAVINISYNYYSQYWTTGFAIKSHLYFCSWTLLYIIFCKTTSPPNVGSNTTHTPPLLSNAI